MIRDIKDIITDMREIVKPCIAQMLFNENFEGKGNTDKAEFETEFEMLLTLAERGVTVEPQEWIPVKDGLPTENGEYYVSVRYECEDGGRFDNVTTCYFWKDDGKWNKVDDWLGKIIAWQPYTEPSPYKGEEECP